MSEEHYANIIREIDALRQEMNRRLDDIRKDVTYEMKLKHQEIGNKLDSNDRRLTFAERMLFGAAGLILITVLGALIARVVV